MKYITVEVANKIYVRFGRKNKMSGKLIENAIKEKLTGEKQKNALDFIAAMREKGFSFEGWGSGDDVGWNPTYNGKGFGCVLVSNQFMFFIGLDWSFDDSGPADDELKEFAWAHVVNCPQEKYCKPPHCENSKNRWQIFQKEFESTCHAPLAFFNLVAKKLENIKKLLLMTKK